MFFLRALPDAATVEGYTGRPDTAETVCAALSMMRRASLLIRRLEKYFARHGLSQLKFLILIVIDREPDRESLRLAEIAERIDVSKPVLHRTIKALTASGLLVAKTDETDRRAEQIFLTPEGRRMLAAILPGYFTEIETFMGEGVAVRQTA